MAGLLFHYTDSDGWKAIASQADWMFKASQPPRPDVHPFGAYFTSLPTTTRNLTKLLRLPRSKTEFFFSFADVEDLRAFRGGRGDFILYSPEDYSVSKARQRDNGPTDKAGEGSQ
jgi:hypothetical protein